MANVGGKGLLSNQSMQLSWYFMIDGCPMYTGYIFRGYFNDNVIIFVLNYLHYFYILKAGLLLVWRLCDSIWTCSVFGYLGLAVFYEANFLIVLLQVRTLCCRQIKEEVVEEESRQVERRQPRFKARQRQPEWHCRQQWTIKQTRRKDCSTARLGRCRFE